MKKTLFSAFSGLWRLAHSSWREVSGSGVSGVAPLASGQHGPIRAVLTHVAANHMHA